MKRQRNDRGSIAIETIGMTVLAMTFIAFIVYALQLGAAGSDIRSAAQQAARAATLEDSPGAAIAAADRVALQNLNDNGIGCDSETQSITTNPGDMSPGSIVEVTISCTISPAGIPLLPSGLAARTFDTSAFEIVDVYRSESP